MNKKALKTLEYEKIISQLTEYAGSAPGKLLCKNLVPSSDLNEIRQAQAETSDAVTRVRMKGNLLAERSSRHPRLLKASRDRKRLEHPGTALDQFPFDCLRACTLLRSPRCVRGISR